MLVLLAPSEGKTPPPPSAAPADLELLAFPALTARRERLIAVLDRLAAGPQRRGLAALGLSAAQAAELARNADLLGAPAAPAAEVYTGVLYQHLDLGSLAPGARARAGRQLFVASALWGVVAIDDRIPAYRLSIGAALPRIPRLAAWWRPALAAALPGDRLVVDLRSAAYAQAWRPAGAPVVEVRAFVERAGTRTPVSHMVKAVRGEVARILVQRRTAPADPQDVAGAVEAAGERVELEAPARPGGAWVLDVIRAA